MYTRVSRKVTRLLDDYRDTPYERHIHPDLRVEDLPLLVAPSRRKYHLLDVPLAAAVTGWHERKLRYRLRFLTSARYLKRYRIPEFKDRENSYPHIYELGRPGARVLAIKFGGTADDYLPTRSSPHPSFLFAPHTIELGRVRFALERAAARLNASLICHYDDRYLARKYRKWPTLPDGYTAIEFHNGVQAYFFLEHDRATANLSKVWARKFGGYMAILNKGYFTQNFFPANPGVGFRVMVTVPTLQRLRSLLRACNRQVPHTSLIDYRTVFNFALLADVEAENAFTAPIWWRADLETPIALF